MNKTLLQRIFHPALSRQYTYKSVRRPNAATDKTNQTTSQLEIPKDGGGEIAPPNLIKQIQMKINLTGPITVAEYMREVLTNPRTGYYMHRDVFGQQGDFITSPEISQIFGELVAIWIFTEWSKLGSPVPFQLIELGPGRGTLARDILKVLTKFKLGGIFSMHFVEISPHLSSLQAQRLCYTHQETKDDKSPHYMSGETATGTKAFWYKCLEDVPHAFTIVLAHEFFDALPVHKLQFHEGVWKEVLIDNSTTTNEEVDFRFVLSKAQTPVSHLYQPIEGETRTSLEYSLETDRIVTMLANRIEQDGGIGLIMDYGHFGEKTDTFRAFKRHKLHDPLKEPGSADLTADVDFRQIKRVAESKGQVICFGPIEQGLFLQKMEGDARLKQLLLNALPENESVIKSGYKMLTDPNEMGKRFKFLSLFPAVMKDHLARYPVNGFN